MHPEWEKKREEFLGSAALRVKNKVLMHGVVKEGYRGKLPLHVIYDETLGEHQSVNHANYIVKSTKPKGELLIAENTKLILVVSRSS
jgi:hypothetical protein